MMNIALVGFGYWGPNVARNINANPNLKLHTICDMIESNIEKAKSIYIETVNYDANYENILNNVNINYFRDDSVVGSSPYKVIIQCSHKTIVADINIIKYTRENIMNFVEKNHNINKKVLIDLLSTDICKKIKLVVEK